MFSSSFRCSSILTSDIFAGNANALVGIGHVVLASGEIETHCGCPAVSFRPFQFDEQAKSNFPQYSTARRDRTIYLSLSLAPPQLPSGVKRSAIPN
jgi:hypothetical protein